MTFDEVLAQIIDLLQRQDRRNDFSSASMSREC